MNEWMPGALETFALVTLGLAAAVGILQFARRPKGALRFVQARLKMGSVYGLSLTLALVVVAASFWAFVEILESWMLQTDVYYLDAEMADLAVRFATPWLTSFMRGVTRLGSTTVCAPFVVLFTVYAFRNGYRWAGAALVVAIILGEALVYTLKFGFDRARPEGISVVVHSASFPSGHSFTAMVVYGFGLYALWKLPASSWLRGLGTLVLPLLILLVGASRIYLHAHFFTDVAGGFILGLAWLVVGVTVTRILLT